MNNWYCYTQVQLSLNFLIVDYYQTTHKHNDKKMFIELSRHPFSLNCVFSVSYSKTFISRCDFLILQETHRWLHLVPKLWICKLKSWTVPVENHESQFLSQLTSHWQNTLATESLTSSTWLEVNLGILETNDDE